MQSSVRILNYGELFTHIKTFITIRVTVIMTIAKLPHTQRLHFSHLSVCGHLLAASLIKWRDNDILSNKAGEAAKANKNTKRKSIHTHNVCIH